MINENDYYEIYFTDRQILRYCQEIGVSVILQLNWETK